MLSFNNTFQYEAFAIFSNPVHANNMLWIEYSNRAYIRFPLFELDPIDKATLKEVFAQTRARLLSYATAASDESVNSYLYLCKSFQPDQIQGSYKRNIKKAAATFEIKKLSFQELEQLGYEAYSDTRKRLGLHDYQRHDFQKRFSSLNHRPNQVIIAAVSNGRVDAFASVLCYHDFVEIEGLFSRNEALINRPNDYIIYIILDTALNKDHMKCVSYGYSTIQQHSIEAGLHRFKEKCGFEAIPIKRYFVFNPTWRLIFNPITRFVIRMLLRIYPSHLKLRKVEGLIRYVE
jgi:hypothetical protein